MTHDVLIAGAGPVGLSLALGLCRAGKSVLVLEKNSRLSEHSRAPAIWPRTQEILADLGVISEFLAQGITLTELGLWDADTTPNTRRLHVPLSELGGETVFACLLILPQEKTEQLLLDALRKQPTANVKFSAELTGLVQDLSGVQFTYKDPTGTEHTARGRFAAGCDGAHSKVRELLGFSLEGFTYSLRAALADIRFAQPLREDLPFPRFSTKEFLAVALRIEKDLWRLILPYPSTSSLELDHRIERAVPRLFPQGAVASGYEVVWKSEFKLHRRISTGLVAGRIALAGDAGHLNSPIGAQGMNAGIQDADVLKDAFLCALNDNSPHPLARYEEIRHTEIRKGVNRFTNALTSVLTLGGGRFVRTAMRLGGLLLRVKFLRRRFLRRAAMLR